ncbi:hypothetical protein EV647_4693 [Kribbella sp. VKM Ac-2566]|nr:hypothetical protein EV647_4693 [Kribbella sp. VKM Ac-2566]
MRLIIRGHALQRMRERHVTREDVENALRGRWLTLPERQNGIQYEGPGLDGRTLKVWLLPPGYVNEDTTMVLKSVAWKDEEGT